MRLGWSACAIASAVLACGDDGSGGSGGSTESSGGGTTTSFTGTVSSGVDTTTGGGDGFCAGPTELVYEPLAGRVDAFPDDFFTVDEATPTGVRVDMRPGENVILEGNATAFASVFEDASTLDGFGTTAGIYLQFTGPLDAATLPPSGEDSASATATLVVVDLDAEPPAFVPFEWELVPEMRGDPRTSLVIEPLVPLPPMHRIGVAMTTGALAQDGECVAPSPTMQELLSQTATDPALARLHERFAGLVEALVGAGTIARAEDLSAAVVYTTQHTVDDSAAIAAEIRAAAPPSLVPSAPCTDPGMELPFLTCQGSYEAADYTGADEAVAADLSVQGTYTLNTTVWLPKGGTAPFPTIVYGHGLAGDRSEGEALAELAAPEGFAVVAVDAPKHGGHPDAGSGVLDFFGLSFDFADPLDSLQLRDNFRQGTYDRLQLVEALRGGVDIDGDATVDLDFDRLHYLGVSLGGIMGNELLAFAPEFDTAILIVPGARVGGIVAEGEQFAVIIDIFGSMATDGEVARFFPILQSVIDRGDAGVYARHVAASRLPGFDGATPQLLAQMVLMDDVVPNSSNAYLARALGLPLVGDELLPIGVVAHEPQLPTAGNLDATHTWGLFQYDVLDAMGTMATHGDVARSEPSQLQILTFLQSYLDDGVSTILDPYRELGIKP
jgi:dienelactone hydrolase